MRFVFTDHEGVERVVSADSVAQAQQAARSYVARVSGSVAAGEVAARTVEGLGGKMLRESTARARARGCETVEERRV